MRKKRKFLDSKDLAIVNAIDRVGPKASTTHLGQILNIPERTVRYRLAKLRESGFLHPLRVITHERKLGLGENILVIQEEQNEIYLPSELFEPIPFFYWYSPTYGKYNGYLVHSNFSLTSLNPNLKLLRAMQQKGLISDYFVFEIVDYTVKNMDLTYFSPEHGWRWDWNKWGREIEMCLQSSENIPFVLEENPSVVDFDFKDILILRHMLENSKITLKQLKDILDLSETQVRKRVRRLEKKGIIKGYKSVFTPIPSKDLLFFYCFLELKDPIDRVLSCFYQLPYTFSLFMESRVKFCIRLSLSVRDFKGFLRGFDLLRPHLVSYFFQTVDHSTTARFQQVYDLFSKETNCWEIQMKNNVNIIKNF